MKTNITETIHCGQCDLDFRISIPSSQEGKTLHPRRVEPLRVLRCPFCLSDAILGGPDAVRPHNLRREFREDVESPVRKR